MKLIIGLGNPGKKYEKNRHNAGAMFVDYASNLGDKFKLFKTDTFMNDSGIATKKYVLRFLPAGRHGKLHVSDDLCIVHDDLDIRLGEFKIQKAKGPRLHNGIESIEKTLGTSDFWRVRIGVDNREAANRTPGEKYVLSNFVPSEIDILKATFEQIFQRLVETLV